MKKINFASLLRSILITMLYAVLLSIGCAFFLTVLLAFTNKELLTDNYFLKLSIAFQVWLAVCVLMVVVRHLHPASDEYIFKLFFGRERLSM